jgi:hypothetical protein
MWSNHRLMWCATGCLFLGAFGACSSGSPPPSDGTYLGDAAIRGGGDAGDAGAATGRGGDAAGMLPDVRVGDGGGSSETEAQAEAAAAVDSGPPVCNPMATWGSPSSVGGLPTGQGATAFTATPDELSVAWAQPVPGSEGGTQIYAADRASADAPFGPAQTLTAAAAYATTDGLALTPDGLGLVVVRADGMAFAQVSRSTRTGAFGSPDETPYQHVNAAVVPSSTSMVGPQFTHLGDPVLSQDNLTLIYSGYGGAMGGSGTVSVYESRRPLPLAAFPSLTVQHDVGPLGVVYAPASPGPSGPCGTCGSGTDGGSSDASAGPDTSTALIQARRHPTGLSSDGRTVFYWDTLAPGAGRAAWRMTPLVEFQSSEVLGSDWHAIVTNASCTRLYFIQQGEFRVVQIAH